MPRASSSLWSLTMMRASMCALPALSPRHVLPPWNRTRQMLKHRASTSVWALLRHALS